MMADPLFEICVEGIDGMLAAQEGGGDRVELCASLLEGGITPGIGTVRAAQRLARVPLHVIVRPRGGDFLYSAAEHEGMCEDIKALGALGVAGVVIGVLTPEGRVDAARLAELMECAGTMRVTFHRAFDMARDAEEALEALIAAGVHRVLTSGQRETAIEGLPMLARLAAQAGERIIVMGCGGLTPETIGRVRREAGLRELHFSALRPAASAMRHRNDGVDIGSAGREREYAAMVTDPALVRATIAAGKA